MLYGGLELDRAHGLRHASDPLALARHPGARICLYWRGRQPVTGEPPVAALTDWASVGSLIDSLAAPLVLLGQDGEAPVVAADISGLEAPEDGPDLGLGRWVMLRSAGGTLPRQDAALLAYARGILIWRERTRFCSVCGQPLTVADAGHCGKCSDDTCGAPHFPRTDSAIIVLVTDPQGRALLGRQPVWAPGMYSCLAGFVEPGETLEEAVAREVWEEAGIRVRSARYVASQPWPFPSSLMIGFMATADGEEPNPDRTEIEDARWFTRAEVSRFGEASAPGEHGRFLPSRDSISRALIQHWLEG
ncbi:NAD(+) diphosphatase [Paramagnetospirillum marisnigri]|nr:NAD(+) diphosphatase [Paramagnetospirillum marisnigri]